MLIPSVVRIDGRELGAVMRAVSVTAAGIAEQVCMVQQCVGDVGVGASTDDRSSAGSALLRPIHEELRVRTIGELTTGGKFSFCAVGIAAGNAVAITIRPMQSCAVGGIVCRDRWRNGFANSRRHSIAGVDGRSARCVTVS